MQVRQLAEFKRWFDRMRDREGQLRVVRQVERIRVAGRYVGDWKAVGAGVVEVRIARGPGYRIYLSIEDGELLLLLLGGDKSSQQKDIERARELLAEWRNEHGNI